MVPENNQKLYTCLLWSAN